MTAPRLAREHRTVEAMIRLYCRDHHGGELCVDCAALREYGRARLDHCPFGTEKPTCAKCPVHCYKPEMREKIKQVMRYSSPRMILRHPILAVRHLMDGKRAAPKRGK